MRKLEGDIAASDEEKPPGKFVQLHELIACCKVLSAGNLQIYRYIPYRNNDVSPLQCLFPDLYCSRTGEARPPVEGRDAGFRDPLFASFWNGLGERTLEMHYLGPINSKLFGQNSFSIHSTSPVNGFGS